jgi:3-dehydroquinate dehydratase
MIIEFNHSRRVSHHQTKHTSHVVNMYLLYSLQTNHSKLILQPLHAACKEAVETVKLRPQIFSHYMSSIYQRIITDSGFLYI